MVAVYLSIVEINILLGALKQVKKQYDNLFQKDLVENLESKLIQGKKKKRRTKSDI